MATRERVATVTASKKELTNEPNSRKSALSLRNNPWGTRSTFTCMAKRTRENAIAVAPSKAPPIEVNSAWRALNFAVSVNIGCNNF
ncbi:hypothetical protein CBM2587_A70052 [Cupriavidus taiwanensis]|uniref:Uncharacterized protein n=1 Tax=Cupriavidus taiwanensis TaxID=164546 RepID=A0A375BW46_9BURK|nr:hypothetical protein CBM2587_A70052 [Cupriavidus taiwanensis]